MGTYKYYEATVFFRMQTRGVRYSGNHHSYLVTQPLAVLVTVGVVAVVQVVNVAVKDVTADLTHRTQQGNNTVRY